LAQTSFRLQNFYSVYGIDAAVFDAQGARLEGTDFRAELYGGATADSLTPALTCEFSQRLILPFFTGPSAGYFQSVEPVCVHAVAPRAYAWLQVRAWDARLGATYEDVAALGIGSYGESPLFYAQGHDPFREPPEPAAPLIGLQSFSLRPIPEPSTWALLLLSGLSIAFVMRRRRP
jgi:PEP-CTERM motif